MPQPQGNSSTSSGRIGGEVGTALAAGNVALGAGWGTTASVAITAGSNDQRGVLTVTSAGTGQSQGTANVTITFADGAYASTPTVLVTLQSSSNAVTESQPTQVTCTTTQASWRHSVLPVASATYRFSYVVIG